MHYVSVNDITEKSNRSERCVQPEPESDEISLTELCDLLSISVATGRNWLKLGKLTPQRMMKRTAYFSREYADSIKAGLVDGTNTALRNRRNKKYVSGRNIYHSYVSDSSHALRQVQSVLDDIEANHISVGNTEICTLVAECAAQLLLHDTGLTHAGNCLEAYLNGVLDLNGYGFLVDDLLPDRNASRTFILENPDLFGITYQYEENEDILGLLYLSVRNLGSRKSTGAYYTPTKVVRKLCTKLFEHNHYTDQTILDPCCGTGNFLLQLPADIPFEKIYANDTDELSVRIARINLALRFAEKEKEALYSHITNEDYLNHQFTEKYDFIIGNPPWGYEFSEEEKNRLRGRYSSAVGSNIESYALFMEQALSDLSINGVLSFVLPEALLNVKTHTPIRRLLMQHCSFQYLDFLGNTFDKVQCPCIIFQVKYTDQPVSCIGMEIFDGHRSFTIGIERTVSSDCFSFLTTDEEYMLLRKIGDPRDKCFLAGHATFALGIVTGNNKAYLSSEKNEFNEPVLKGSDLRKYYFHAPDNYIVFKPESFQQAAPAEYYRAPEKLLYRFICNQLVFAYDDGQTLSLNSCNLLIPQIEGLSAKYILAVLNSRVAQFYFRKIFYSVKVLRSHIEQIPIPFITKEQQEKVLNYVELLLAARDADIIVKTFDELDLVVSQLFGLTDAEYDLIKSTMEGENLFLI